MAFDIEAQIVWDPLVSLLKSRSNGSPSAVAALSNATHQNRDQQGDDQAGDESLKRGE